MKDTGKELQEHYLRFWVPNLFTRFCFESINFLLCFNSVLAEFLEDLRVLTIIHGIKSHKLKKVIYIQLQKSESIFTSTQNPGIYLKKNSTLLVFAPGI